MKITLEFEEEDRFIGLCAVRGIDLYSALSDIDCELRNRIKHDEDTSDKELLFLQSMREYCSIARELEDMH